MLTAYIVSSNKIGRSTITDFLVRNYIEKQILPYVLLQVTEFHVKVAMLKRSGFKGKGLEKGWGPPLYLLKK